MSVKSNYPLSFDADAWELSVVTHRPRKWLPLASHPGIAVNPRSWQTRAARGFSWHRDGRASRREQK